MYPSLARSQHILAQAQRYLPGGVSGTLRLVEPNLVFTHAQGAYLYDAEGRRYLDYHLGFGPMILGHCHPEVTERVIETMTRTDLIGIGSSDLEAHLAAKICQHVPSAEKVVFCNSGSEATYLALRLARAATGRQKIIKFQGCYHGWHDAVLQNVISPVEKLGQKDPLSAGMLSQAIENTLVLPFNDAAAVAEVVRQYEQEIAAVILEPLPHNMGCVLPQPGFLQTLRRLTERLGIVLIFDEVITGFRHGLGGYQQIAGVLPDLTTLAKAMANGYPLACVAGRADLLEQCGPGGPVFFAGTYNAHPASVAAALATIEVLERPDSYAQLFHLGSYLRQGLSACLQRYEVAATVAGFGSVFLTYFLEPPIESYADLLRNDTNQCLAYRRKLIARGIYQLPVPLKRNYLSLAHTEADLDETIQAVDAVLGEMQKRW